MGNRFKKILNQWGFLKNNFSLFSDLLKLRFQVITFDLAALVKSFLLTAILVGIAIVFFFIFMLSLFFGLNELIVEPVNRLWLFFGLSIGSMILFILIIVWSVRKIGESLSMLINSLNSFNQELSFLFKNEDNSDILFQKVDQLKED